MLRSMISSSENNAGERSWRRPSVPGRRPRRRLALLDLDALRPGGRLRHGERDLEDAVLEVGLRARRVEAFGQGDGSAERAVASLRAIRPLALLLDLGAPLALEDEPLVGELDADVILAQARQVGADDEPALPLDDVDLRLPQRREGHAAELQVPPLGRRREAPGDVLVEEAVHVVHHASHQRERARTPQAAERRYAGGGAREAAGGLSGAALRPRHG